MIQTTNQMYIWGGLLNLGVAMGSPMLGNLHISYNDALPMNCLWAWSEHKLMTETIHCDEILEVGYNSWVVYLPPQTPRLKSQVGK